MSAWILVVTFGVAVHTHPYDTEAECRHAKAYVQQEIRNALERPPAWSVLCVPGKGESNG